VAVARPTIRQNREEAGEEEKWKVSLSALAEAKIFWVILLFQLYACHSARPTGESAKVH
jgi:hypothetical protein